MYQLKRAQTEASKQQKMQHKRARQEEQEERKRWVKQQAVRHGYGNKWEDYLPDDGGASPDDSGQGTSTLVVSNVTCSKCGGSDDRRSSSRLCPHYKGRKEVVDTSSGSDAEESQCTCGGDRAHYRTCPMNPRNLRK